MSAFLSELRRAVWSLTPMELSAGESSPSEPTLPLVKDDDDLDRVLRDYLGVKLPHLVCCANHKTPWDAVHDAFFARSPISVWKASRGFGGKSFTLSALSMAEALFLRADVNILGGSGEQSKRILESIGSLWEAPGFPKQCMHSETPGAQRQVTIWKNKIVALMASQTSVRGPHPQRLRMDEVDEMALAILNSALGQPMSKGWVQSQVVLSSTHQYPAGTMTEMLKRAATEGWPVFEWCLAGDSLVLTEHGQQAIRDVTPGTLCWAFTGDRFILLPATDVWSNGKKLTIRVTTESGHIDCTPEHRIRTEDGWVYAAELRPGDRIVTADAVQVWPAETAEIEHVPAVLSPEHGATKQGEPGSVDDGTRDGAVSSQAVESGSAGRRTVGFDWGSICNIVRHWAIRCGFLRAQPEAGGGSLRATSPEVLAGHRTGQGTEGDDRGQRADVGDSFRPGSTPVVSVATNGRVEVWDLSLPEYHAFVANGLVVHNCYRENLEPHGWLSMSEVTRKRAILTAGMWDTEIELQEPSSEGRAFDSDQVEKAFVQTEPIRYSKEAVVLEDPVPGAKYGTGADWAKKKNHTVIVTIRHDVVPARVVCVIRTQKRPWPDMIRDLDIQAKRYPGTVVHDNTGLGQVVDDLITVKATPFDMVGRQRAELLSEYVSSIEQLEIQWPRNNDRIPLASAYAEHKYATREDLYKGSKDGSSKAHLPDTVSAGAFAWRACGGVSPASAVRQPDADENPHLQKGIKFGRFSRYMRGQGLLDDDNTER